MISPESEKLLRDFDRAWQAGSAPPLAAVLNAAPAEARRPLLEELITIDLEYRWQGGSRPTAVGQRPEPGPRLEDYAAEFPELGPAAQLPLELIAQEYEVRHSWGDRPAHAEYLVRFPAHGEALRTRLAAVDLELATEYAGRSSARSLTASFTAQVRPPADAPARPTSGAEVVAALESLPLLAPEQRQEVAGDWAARFPEPHLFVQELLHRGWVTAYQADQLLLGRGPDLVVGSYLLLDRLGEGGIGQVFKARHLPTEQIAAVKVIRKELLADLEVVTRFQREMRVLRELQHPNIVGAYDTDDAGTALLLAMEYVEGIDLSRLVKETGPLPVATACDYIRQAAVGLQYAHEKGLVHRDIKPSNLLVTAVGGRRSADGDQPRAQGDSGPRAESREPIAVVKILDLGLARLRRSLDGETTHTLGECSLAATMTPIGSVMMGTPDYMAPEQALDFHRADTRSDIYSLGCTFFFLLTGRPPFTETNLAAKLLQHQQGEPPPVSRLRSEVPPGVASLLHRMLAKDPRQRPQTPAAVVAALENPAATAVPPARSGWRRWSTALARVSAALVLLAVGLLLFAGSRTPPEKTEPPTTPAVDDASARCVFDGLRARAPDPEADRTCLRRDLIAFRGRFPGSAESIQAAEFLTDLPSPLDRLDPRAIPADERLPQPCPQLVAVLGRRCFRHRGTVEAAVYSPDRKLLATSGSNDGAVHIWDTETWKERTTLRAPASQVPSLAWAPDGKTLATGFETTLRLWDPATWQERDPPLRGHTGPIARLAYSHDGTLLASASHDRTVRLWDTATGKERRQLSGHSQAVTALAFSPDDRLVATGSNDRTIKVWDVATGRELHTLPLQPAVIGALVFTSDGKSLISGSDDGRVVLWNVADWKEQKVLRHPMAVRSLAFLDCGQTLLAGCRDGTVKFWDIVSGQLRFILRGHTGYIYCLDVDPAQGRLVSGGVDGTLRIWDLAERKELCPGSGHAGAVYSVAFSPDGTLLASGGVDQTARLWDPTTLQELYALSGHGGPVYSVAFTPDGHTLASGSYDGHLRLWDAVTFRVKGQTNTRGSGFISGVAIAPDGRAVALACQHGPIRLCDSTTLKEVAVLPGHKPGVDGVAFAPDGHSLASGGIDGTTKVWSIPPGKEPASLQSRSVRRVRAVAYAPDGRLLAAGNADGSVSLWDLSALREKTALAGHTGDVFALAFSPTGRVLATAGMDGRVILWDPASGTKLEEISLPASVYSLAFTPDGRHLATAGSNGALYLFRCR